MAGFSVKTTRRCELVEVTSNVASLVEASGILDGVAHIYVPHTTCGVTINEAADPSVAEDIVMMLDELVPRAHPKYRHHEGNSRRAFSGRTTRLCVSKHTCSPGV